MSASNGERHPFLDDLTADAELTSTLMRRAVTGRENIKKLIAAVGSLYKSQTRLSSAASSIAASCNTTQCSATGKHSTASR